MRRLRIGTLICIATLILLLSGCGKKEANAQLEDSTTTETTETQEPVATVDETTQDPDNTEDETSVDPVQTPKNLSPYTGLEIDEALINVRPIGVMISNIKAALPQSGISQADIIYETLVEGGITRMFAIFHDFSDVTKIGPIRSSRHYYLDFALDNDAIYTHYGQSTYATAAFKVLDVDRFYGIGKLDTLLSFRDPNRKAPHSTYTSYEKLMATWDYLDYRREIKPDARKFAFNTEDAIPVDGDALIKIDLNYSPYITATFEYNVTTGLYERFQFGDKQIDVENGEQLAFKNVIVQYADIWQIKGDKLGCMDMTLITKGDGLFITDGKMIPITWEKKSHESPTTYYTQDGSPIVLNPGKTFISVFPLNRVDKIITEGKNE